MLPTSTPATHLLLLAALAPALLGACRSTGPAGSASARASAPKTVAPKTVAPKTVAPKTVAPKTVAEAPGGERLENTIRWATASEVDNFGFDVYRSESEEGPFARLNQEVIEGAGTTDEPQRYEFVDAAIEPHKTYYYYVEAISMSGERERFTPVGKAPPKVRGSSER